MKNLGSKIYKKSFFLENTIFFFIILLIFSIELGTNYVYEGAKIRYPFYLILILLIFIAFMYLLVKGKLYFHIEDWFILLFFPIISLIILSYELNIEIIVALVFLFSLLILSLSLKLIELNHREKIIKKIILYLILYSFIITFINFLLETPSFYRYSGIFDNSNSAGRFAGFFAGISFLAVFNYSKYRKSLILITIITLFILVISNSRAPMVALVIAILASSMRSFKQLIIFLFTITLLCFIFYIIYINSEIFKYAVDSKMSRGSSGRLEIWIISLDFIKLYPSNYFNIYTLKDDPHNNYLSLSLVYGLLYTSCLYFYILIILSKSFFIKYKEINPKFRKYNNYIIFCLTWTLIYGLFETSTHITPLYTGLILYWLISADFSSKNKMNEQ